MNTNTLDLGGLGIEPKSAVSVAESQFTRPLIDIIIKVFNTGELKPVLKLLNNQTDTGRNWLNYNFVFRIFGVS